MDVVEQVARMKATLGGLVRDQADRFAGLEQRGEQIRAEAQEKMTTKVKAAERYVEHRRELGQRAREAGGWATGKTLSDKSHLMGFGPEEDAAAAKPVPPRYDAPVTGATQPPPAPASGWQEPPTPPEEAPKPEPPRRRAKHRQDEESFDDDDFSNNSWMVP